VNLAAVLEARASDRGYGDRPAIVVGSQTSTHGEVHDGAARLASMLAGHGVRRGDRVLLALPDGVEFAWAFLGCVRLGALAVPVNPQLPADDHRVLAADCRAGAAVCDDGLAERFSDHVVLRSSTLAAARAAHDPHPAVAVAQGDPAYAQYTSGTTGAPRAAVHRHGDPLAYAAAFSDPALGLGVGDVVLSVSKMYFAYGLGNSLFFPLLSGARAVVHPGRPSALDIASLVSRHGATVLFAVPTFYANLLREAPAMAGGSLRLAVSAGERLPASLAERTSDLLGCPVVDSLGSTEVGQAFASGTVGLVPSGALGRALPPYEVAVRDDDGRDLAPGATGMLWVRGPTVLLEYLGQPEATAAAFDGDDGDGDGRWLRTGDLASLDGDGFLTHHGRADDMEMVGGISVGPQEIEDLVRLHPAVSEVAVVAVADGDGASRLQAFVVPAPDVAADDALAAELTALARSRLAAFKVPRSVTFVEALPRTPTGKLRRFVLRSGNAWPTLSRAG